MDASMLTYIDLERALRAGDLDAVRSILDEGGRFPNVRDPYTSTPLLALALDWAPLDAIEELLVDGADPNLDAQDGFPALVAVALSDRADRLELLELLLRAGADVGRRGVDDWTPLHAAAVQDDAAAVELLLRHGADPGARTGIGEAETPLELARRLGSEHAAAALL